MIKNIFFIHRFHFNKCYYNSDNFDRLKAKGYNVKYIDLVGLLKSSKIEDTCPSDLKEEVIYIKTKAEFCDFLAKYREDSILATCVGLQVNSAWFYRIISQADIPYVFLDVNFFPKLSSKNRMKSVSTRIVRYFEKISPIYLLTKLVRSIDYYYTLTQLRSALAVLHVKTPIRKRILKITNENTLFVRTTSNDWQTACDASDLAEISQKYLVFIDQYIPYHPDFVSRGIDLKFTPEEYYQELNAALKKISLKTGLQVIIAAHPRRVEMGDYDFPMISNKTASLVKNSDLVIAHYSTAVNFAAVYGKPLVFFSSELLNRSYIGTYIADMSYTFGKEPLLISSDSFEKCHVEDLLHVDKDLYKKFIQENLAPSESNTSSLAEILDDLIQFNPNVFRYYGLNS
jgi:hypothetical protein